MKTRLTVVALFAVASVPAQEFRATLNGRVADSSGAAVPNVPVQVRNAATNEVTSSVTDGQGNYTAPFLRPGTYSIAVEAAGFKRHTRDGVVLNVGQSATVNITLELGAVTEQITVTGEAPLLETAKSDRGQVIDQKAVHEFPLNARNPFMLSMLVAGVNFNGNAIYQRPFDNGAIADWSINGSRNRTNEFLLDGAPNNAQAGGNNIAYVPPVDSVQEFKIQTNSYDAQYGKTGGGIVNVSLKSGTNALHGSIYEFARRNAWDANSFQNNSRGVPKEGHFLDQYGIQVGGPIVFPKLYNGRDKSFFMLNYEGYREGTPTPLNLSTAAPEFLEGDFSRLVDSQNRQIRIFDPSTGRDGPGGTWLRDPFPGNRIPQGRITPLARNLIARMPKPNTTTPGQGYSVQNLFIPGGDNVDRDDFYNFVAKFDQNFGDTHRVFFRHASNDRTEIRPTNAVKGPGEDGQLPLKRVNDAYVVDWVATVRSDLIFNLRTSISRYIEGSRGDGNAGFDLTSLGFPASLASALPIQGF
ncbi:MAG: carboxypeptidase regulatory-like domain-containing protein, partial [Bryobacteraceae bacterium]